MVNYIEGESIIHKINGTIKLLSLIIVSIYIFTINDYFTLNIILLVAIVMFILTGIKVKYYLKLIRNSIIFILITFLINFLFSDVVYSFLISYRIFIMLLFTIILTLTTKPMEIVYGITNLLYPLKLFGVNTKDISLMVGIGISFMPILKNEYTIVTQAQNAKGYFPNMKEIKKYCICVFVPYLIGVLKKSDEISTALQAKGYEN